jgi:hypothetical protein
VTFEDVALSDMQEGSDPDALSIERVGDTYEVNGVMDLTSDDAELEGNPFEDQIAEAFDTAELRIAITFPGEVLETNGRVDGTTVTWEPVFGERTELTAVASATGDASGDDGGAEPGSEAAGGSSTDGGNTALSVILGLVIVAVVVGLFLVWRRRSGASPATDRSLPEEPAAVPAPAPPPPPPPSAAAPRDDEAPGGGSEPPA